ncbi:beta-N-acetylhexosaminidase [Jiella sp. M17.18]|uniref:beta-N-acetylhexosaminidase n=1 Tax=Jiella sp. M17.18 TaxID=3234247 RepID=UPI0034DF7464
MSSSKSFIAAPSGHALTAEERAFFADERPWGYILFARNISSGSQVRDLVAELRDLGGRATTPIFVDQEGGRVQRLRPPLAPDYPPAESIGRLHAVDPAAGERAAWLHGRLLAEDLTRYGINADCVPCLDVPVEGADSVIGSRAYGTDPEVVATLGRAVADGLAAGGLLPVMKHMPGHGRGNADSHLALPVVRASRNELARTDFVPFKALAGLPAAMTAHILYSDIDPTRPATLSPIVIGDVIRSEIGFDGLLMSDDMSMKALSGDLFDLSRRALTAGCDVVLHCNGDMEEMRHVARACQPLAGDAERRARAAEGAISPQSLPGGDEELRREYHELMSRLG